MRNVLKFPTLLGKEFLVLLIEVVDAACKVDYNTEVPSKPDTIQSITVVVTQHISSNNTHNVAQNV
jgi:hypothetical protein